MSDNPPTTSVSAPPAPFEAGPRPGRGAPGCGKPLVIGCGVVIGLLAVGLVLFFTHLEGIARWSFERVESEVMAGLPASISEAERERLERAFAGALERMAAGEADPASLRALQADLLRLVRTPPERRSREDIQALLLRLERVAGVEPEGEGGGDTGAAPRPEEGNARGLEL